jgi:hypothetical protein
MRHPITLIVRRWNWKTALLSACTRGSLFFFTNLNADLSAALSAFSIEAACYAVLAGFYGALLQSFRRAQPAWAATLTVMVILPTFNHTVELAVHWLNGTPQLGRSVLVSVVFSLFSACFNLFAMRRGVLVVGREHHTLFEDLWLLPSVVTQFVVAAPLALWQCVMRYRER